MALSIRDKLSIGDVDRDGEVELELETWENPASICLSQGEIKQVIAFLKKQLK